MKIIRQRDLKDCGICALESIIEFYGGKVSLEQLRMDAKVSLEGTTALNLILTAKKYGFDAVGQKVNNLEEIKTLPAIAHMNLKNGLNHYVVIYKITKDKVVLMDPNKGRVIKNKKDFYEEWSKIILLFYPHQKITVLDSKNTLLSIFGKIMLSEKKLILMIALISILLTIFTIASGYYFQFMANAINNNWDLVSIKIILIIFGVITLIKIMGIYFRGYLENHLNKNIDCILNGDFLLHLYRLPLNVVASRTSGEILTRVNELMGIKNIITSLFISSSLDFSLMIVAIPLLININSKLFFILFLFLGLYLLVGTVSSKIIYKKAYQNIECEEAFNAKLIEDIKMFNSIKNLNVTDIRLKELETTTTKYLYDTYLFNVFLNKDNSIKNGISEICMFLVTSLGFYFVLQNKITIVELITFNTLLNLFFDPLKNIIDGLPKYNFLKAAITKINDFLSVSVEDMGKVQKLDNNEIIINNLRYSYNKYENTLNNVNAKINSGDMVLLSGKSGSGKSTLCKILDKYITDYEGEILIGGINIRDLSVSTIRQNILYVCQNESLFTGTIKDNITLNKDIPIEKFNLICSICKVNEIVKNKPLRYDTCISNEASNISGGEKQRIILARGLLNDFNILMLDEALSEVDYKLETKIVSNIRKQFKNKTIIYVTHKKLRNLFDQTINVGGCNEFSRSN